MTWTRGINALLAAAVALPACSDGTHQRARDAEPASAAAASAETPETRGRGLDALISTGESIYFSGAYDSARTIWSDVVRTARSDGDHLSEAKALTWMGLAAWKQGDYREAAKLGEEALALKLRFRLDGELFKSYNALGLVAWNEGRLSRAKELFERGLESARRVGDAKGVAGTSANLALVQTDLGDFAAARNGFTTALAAGRALGDERIRGNALTNLAMLDIRVGDPRSAASQLREARNLYRAIGYAAGEQNVLGQLGVAYAGMGQPPAAFAALDSALSLVRAHGLRQEEADNLEEIADFHRQAGDLRSALRIYEQARRLNSAMGRILETGDDLRSEAEIHAALGDMALAVRYAEEALRIHREAGARLSELDDLLLLARLSSGEPDHLRVESYFTEARHTADLLGTRPARIAVALAEAEAVDRRNDADQVLHVLAGLDLDFANASYAEQAQAEGLRARALANLGMLESAAVVGRQAVASFERARAEQASGLLRTAYLAQRGSVYADLVSVLLRIGRQDEAFEFADAARARALLEHLTMAGDMASRINPTTGTLAQGEELLRRIQALVARLDETASEATDDPANARIREELNARLTAARSEYEDLMARTSGRDGAMTAFLGARHVRAHDVSQALQPDEALLEYLATQDDILLFVVHDGKVSSFHCGIAPANLASRVRLANDLLRRPAAGPDGRAWRVLSALYETLLRPAVETGALRGARRLVIVPHQTLVYLPFAALRDGRAGRYVVQDYSLLYLPSAAALPLLRSRERAKDSSDEPAPGSVFAPFPEALPATLGEAEIFRRAVPGSRMYLGARATETRLRQALAGRGLVHVASHASLNPANPMFSQIQLEPGSMGRSDDDGRLEVHELLEVPMASALVFLSGCETGLGPAWSTSFARGDDYATLSQAFLYGGVGNVVSTLWPVEDTGAAAFARHFYGSLMRLPPPEAMAEAQRSMLKEGKYAAPYYWAGYETSGSGDIVPAKTVFAYRHPPHSRMGII